MMVRTMMAWYRSIYHGTLSPCSACHVDKYFVYRTIRQSTTKNTMVLWHDTRYRGSVWYFNHEAPCRPFVLRVSNVNHLDHVLPERLELNGAMLLQVLESTPDLRTRGLLFFMILLLWLFFL